VRALAVNILPFLTSIVTFYGIYLILAISFNLEYGFTGQPNFGKVFFYSIGAYVAGRLTATLLMGMVEVEDIEFFSHIAADLRLGVAASHPPVILSLFFASLLLAALLGGVFGFLASYPALRLRGDFLAIVLIAMGEIGRVFVRTYTPLTGGVYGLSGVPNPLVWLGEPDVWRGFYAIMVLAIAFTVYLFANKLVNSPYGRVLKSVRDDELASNVLGKNAPRVKGQILIIGSAIASVAGALYAFYIQTIFPDDFVPMITFNAVTMVMLGGVANNTGIALGALILTLLDRLTRASFLKMVGITVAFDITYLRYVTIGILMILILMFKPEGLIPEKPVKTPALKIAKTYGSPQEKP
jgi:branched-chain amino acid transport system permease protein